MEPVKKEPFLVMPVSAFEAQLESEFETLKKERDAAKHYFNVEDLAAIAYQNLLNHYFNKGLMFVQATPDIIIFRYLSVSL